MATFKWKAGNVFSVWWPDSVESTTETQFMENIGSALEIVTRLRIQGLKLSIDDFGTGYSSMAQLKSLPFTELKIDRSFVHNAWKDSNAKAILESSIN